MTQTTPTRDDAVPADGRRIDLPNGYYLFQIRPSDMTCSLHMPDGLHVGNLLAQYAADFAAAMLASAPAPASGGVDAVAEVVAEELALKIVSLSVNWLREDGTDREHEDYVRANWTKEIAEAKRLILASLSPAATPVSEAGPVATERPYWRDYPADQKVSPALAFDGGCLTINGQGYGDRDGAGVFAFKDDDLRWGHGEDEGYRYVHVGKSDLEAIRQAIASAHGPYALAKSASSPAGVRDDVLVRAVKRAMENAGTLPAKEAVKLVPADWHRICDLVLGASQSTSAGRGNSDAS